MAGEAFREGIIRSRELGVDKNGGRNTMKIFRNSLIIVLVILAGRTLNANAQTVTILHSFGCSDGAYPLDGLAQGNDGNFYGTTQSGGASTNCQGWDENCQYGCGTIFRVEPSGTFSNLYSFSGTEGAIPHAGLVQGSDGNFYGTTPVGGANGYGTVFRISSSGNLTNLYSFTYSALAGASQPVLVQGSDGYFYGTTPMGGANGSGTVFRISASGNFTNLYSFSGPDGANPQAGLVQGSDGDFYGTTQYGGASTNCYQGCGTVFRITPSGSLTNLHSFVGYPTDGSVPVAELVQGSDGNFYGVAGGTVFRVSPSGNFTNLYYGVSSPAWLVQGSDGNFYGTTPMGGASTNCFSGCGTVFRISPSGSFSNLYSFSGNDGSWPFGGLAQGSDGNFYGTTVRGGTNDMGIVFKLTVPLNPPANQIAGIELSGTNIIFSIPSIVGETYQLQYRNSMSSGNWVNVPGVSVTNSIGALLTLTNFGGANQPQGFYRFDITP